jgi:hypothetical protein
MRRRVTISRVLLMIMLAVMAIGAVISTVVFVLILCGDDAVPSAIFLSALVLGCLYVGWQYFLFQAKDEDDFHRQRRKYGSTSPAETITPILPGPSAPRSPG